MTRLSSDEATRATRELVRHAATGIERFEAVWRTHQTRPHAHPEYQLTWTLAGVGRVSYRGGRGRIDARCMALFHPGEPHVLENAEPRRSWSLRVLHVPSALLEQHGVPRLLPAPFLGLGRLVELANALWAALASSPTSTVRAHCSSLSRALNELPGLDLEEHPSSQLVRRCLDILAAEHGRSIGIAELAERVACPAVKLRKLFVAATGLPPHAWHLQRRIQQGKHLLARGASAAEVALATGFTDQAHFTRHFTLLVGVSPARYAAAVVRER